MNNSISHITHTIVISLIMLVSFTHHITAQKIIGKTKLDCSDRYLKTYNVKQYGEFTYLTFIGSVLDTIFVDDKPIIIDKSTRERAFYLKFDKNHKLVHQGIKGYDPRNDLTLYKLPK